MSKSIIQTTNQCRWQVFENKSLNQVEKTRIIFSLQNHGKYPTQTISFGLQANPTSWYKIISDTLKNVSEHRTCSLISEVVVNKIFTQGRKALA